MLCGNWPWYTIVHEPSLFLGNFSSESELLFESSFLGGLLGGVEEEAARGASFFTLPAVLFRECFALGASVFRAPVNFRFLYTVLVQCTEVDQGSMSASTD